VFCFFLSQVFGTAWPVRCTDSAGTRLITMPIQLTARIESKFSRPRWAGGFVPSAVRALGYNLWEDIDSDPP